MKTSLTKLVLAFIGLTLNFADSASAQSDINSLNIVGYINRTFQTGDNLIADQLIGSPDNNINTVLTSGVLAGSTFTLWDPGANQLLPLSTFNGATWSINYALGLGDGGVLNSPGPATNTFVGNVSLNGNGDPFWPAPNRGGGTFLISYGLPIAPSSFTNVVGRGPLIGESVRTLNEASQLYSTTTFTGSGWDNGEPGLAIGQSAYFTLVPEPSTACLAVLSATIGIALRTAKRSRTTPAR